MADAQAAHPGLAGHAALAWRSAGVTAPLQLSSTADSRKPINFKRRLIILGGGGGNCKSNGPLILVGVQPLSFHAKQEATSLSALPFSSQFVFSPLSGCIHPTLVMKDISYRVWRKPRRSSAPRMEQTGQYDTQSHYVCVCVCMYDTLECQLTNTEAAAFRVQWPSLWKQSEPKPAAVISHQHSSVFHTIPFLHVMMTMQRCSAPVKSCIVTS